MFVDGWVDGPGLRVNGEWRDDKVVRRIPVMVLGLRSWECGRESGWSSISDEDSKSSSA